MNKKQVKLNFGCGHRILKDYVNIDLYPLKGVDVVLDMNMFPYPFKDNSADRIICESTMQFVNDITSVMKEFHRILKPNGTLFLHVPHFTSKNTWKNPYHKRGFSYGTFGFYQNPKYHYTDWKFKKIKTKLVFGKKYALWNYIVELIAKPWCP